NPQSTLAKGWPYYITPAEQTPEVQAQLDALIQTRVREDGDTLNPESITVLDPACGSGHILVVAYDVLKAIYLERGYQPRAIPRLILEKNLFGLDIDDRAAQMAGFALLMKARADDRRLFTATDEAGNLQPPKLNVLSLQTSNGLSVDELATHLAPFKVQRAAITGLVDTFEHAKTFGSLIQIPDVLKTHLAVLPEVLALVKQSGELYASAAADDLLPLLQQAQVLAMQFDAVVANPPYMGGKGMMPGLKDFAKQNYPDSRSDLFAMFLDHGFALSKPTGFNSMVTMHSWMFLSSYEELRLRLIRQHTIHSLAHLGPRAFSEIAGEIVQTVAFSVARAELVGFKPVFQRLVEGDESQKNEALLARQNVFSSNSQREFEKIPAAPLAYWLGKASIGAFENLSSIGAIEKPRQGMSTNDNSRFVRRWHEVNWNKVGLGYASGFAMKESGKKWFPYNKGGEFRKWFGNADLLVNWEDDGAEIKNWLVNNPSDPRTTHWSRRIINIDYYGKSGLTWTFVSSNAFGIRYTDEGFLFDVGGSSLFPGEKTLPVLSLLCTKVAWHFLKALNPTVNMQTGNIADVPWDMNLSAAKMEDASRTAKSAIDLARADWNSFETSWNFIGFPQVKLDAKGASTADSWDRWRSHVEQMHKEMQTLEVENNRLFINAYGLQDELTPEVPESQITLARADREKDCQRLISYAIGCMMGRYSLDEPGLIYAHAGNVGFEPGRYATFPADADGIVPITDEIWFADDACSRIREFLRAVWGLNTLEENMAWLAESLGSKASETPDETIRRYIADKFFRDHLQTYKKRPIYWLFSSGKQGAFQALVYLHRYHEGTLARLRAEYVVPLTGKIQSRIEMLQKDAAAASSTAARNKLAKEVEKLKKKHVELLAYDEQLRHYADMRITLNLDDGVKVNYGKFGDLLAEVKAVTGGAGED
ncbi:MAG: BREX-1 system adenine-specific DNA-methyltransferase PglX, partial [Pseudomonadota bacterium]